MNHFKADAGNLVKGRDTTVQQLLQHGANGLPVGREHIFAANSLAAQIIFVIKKTLGSTDTLGATGTQNFFTVIHIKKLVF
jgi:hypothetical protein